MTVLPKQLKQPPAPPPFVDNIPPQPAKKPDPWPFEHGQTCADHAGNVYRASVTARGIVLANLNKSATWQRMGQRVGFVEGYFWKPGQPLKYGKYDLDYDYRLKRPVVTWTVEQFPAGDIKDLYPCRVVEQIIKLEL